MMQSPKRDPQRSQTTSFIATLRSQPNHGHNSHLHPYDNFRAPHPPPQTKPFHARNSRLSIALTTKKQIPNTTCHDGCNVQQTSNPPNLNMQSPASYALHYAAVPSSNCKTRLVSELRNLTTPALIDRNHGG
jgi:hypothetical protein